MYTHQPNPMMKTLMQHTNKDIPREVPRRRRQTDGGERRWCGAVPWTPSRPARSPSIRSRCGAEPRNDAVVAVSRDGGERRAGVAQYRESECYVSMAAHRRPAAAVASRNVHQPLLPCLLVASKVLDDLQEWNGSHHNSAFFPRDGGVSNAVMNKLELELLAMLEFEVSVSHRVYELYRAHLERKESQREGGGGENGRRRRRPPNGKVAHDWRSQVTTAANGGSAARLWSSPSRYSFECFWSNLGKRMQTLKPSCTRGSHPLAEASAVLGFERSQLPPQPCLLLSVSSAVMASGPAASASAPAAAAAGATAGTGKDDELADLVRRLVDALSRYSDRLPFDLDRQKLRSLTTLAAITVTLIFAWKLLRAPQEQPRRPRRRVAPSPSNTSSRSWPGALTSTDACSSSADSRAQEAINQLFQPANLTLEQLVRHKLSEGRRVTCRLLGVILEETTPEELQNHVTVRPSVLEVLLEIAKFCDVYLMERILDDESGEKVLSALSEAGLCTSGGLIKDKVLFCSTENGRISFVRQIEPDWHIDTSPDIVHQLAVELLQTMALRELRPTSLFIFTLNDGTRFFFVPCAHTISL
ncbi:hypothetical protein ABZP36_007843 [Zizania latifolia]